MYLFKVNLHSSHKSIEQFVNIFLRRILKEKDWCDWRSNWQLRAARDGKSRVDLGIERICAQCNVNLICFGRILWCLGAWGQICLGHVAGSSNTLLIPAHQLYAVSCSIMLTASTHQKNCSQDTRICSDNGKTCWDDKKFVRIKTCSDGKKTCRPNKFFLLSEQFLFFVRTCFLPSEQVFLLLERFVDSSLQVICSAMLHHADSFRAQNETKFVRTTIKVVRATK